jgi:hypothetical protein
MAIDWGFIAKLEGASNCGYVPDANSSRSGVTIASGVDLSAENEASIRGLPDDLQARLRPYLGLTGAAALEALRAYAARRSLTTKSQRSTPMWTATRR